MDRVKSLTVRYEGEVVGTLALYRNHLVAFEYSAGWLANGFSISPFSMPLEKKLYMPKVDPFEGLFGVFADSLPDGWGRLLVDRLMIKNGVQPQSLTSLDRLAVVGSSGMGALTYEPEYQLQTASHAVDLDKIAKECEEILAVNFTEDLDELFRLGGSSGGARPKILTSMEDKDWLIKFPSSEDSKDIGHEEYMYSQCAKECGIQMTETKLFDSNKCSGYFGTVRFDRRRNGQQIERIHMHSVAGLLETSHRIPNLDYNILMKLTLELTKDFALVEQMYLRMCFNVFTHNRDDHSKNFAFLYDESEEAWVLSPAYDLTYSYSFGGEHATAVNGNGLNPGFNELIAVGKSIGMKERDAKRKAEAVYEIVKECGLLRI